MRQRSAARVSFEHIIIIYIHIYVMGPDTTPEDSG